MELRQIEAFWALLGQTWGAKFYEQYGPKANDAWTSALASVTPEAARHALQTLITEGSAFPPTLPEFAKHAATFRPVSSSVPLLHGPGKTDSRKLAEGASDLVTRYKTYNEYRTYRLSSKPPHPFPTPESPDWWYLHVLAHEEAEACHRRNARSLGQCY